MKRQRKYGESAHGTLNEYSNYGCRCVACTAANTAHKSMWDKLFRPNRNRTAAPKAKKPRESRVARIAREPRVSAPKPPKFIYVKTRGVYYCHCHAPVPVDSWQGHFERTGHMPPWLANYGKVAA